MLRLIEPIIMVIVKAPMMKRRYRILLGLSRARRANILEVVTITEDKK
jgi:hypothetical protein